MKKIFSLIICFIFIVLIFILDPVPAKSFEFKPFENNNEGYFKKINNDFPVYGTPVKLKDGRVLITDCNFVKQPDNIIFDPKTNKFKKTVPFNNDIYPDEGILLNNGKVFFIGPMYEQPSEKFLDEIYDEMKKEKSFSGLEFRKYRELPEEEKKKIYLPIFEKNPELMKKYNEYLKAYDNSMCAQLYNPDTGKFEYSGRLNIRRWGIKATLLKDGRILIAGGGSYGKLNKEAEIYDPSTGKFTLLDKFDIQADSLITLEDGSVLIFVDGNYVIYDPIKNTYSAPKPFEKNYRKTLKLKDGRLLIFIGKGSDFSTYKINNPPEKLTGGTNANVYLYQWQQYNAMILKIYDPSKDKFSFAGTLAIPRGDCMSFCFDAVVLKDGRVLITGGQKDIEKFGLGDLIKMMSEAEIFDPTTGKSKLIKNMNYEKVNHKSVLLDDERVLLYGGYRHELYRPKEYK